jgi:hypothetical protein
MPGMNMRGMNRPPSEELDDNADPRSLDPHANDNEKAALATPGKAPGTGTEKK